MSTLKTNNIQHVDRSEPSILINTDGSVNIAGTMTYEDVTNVDAVGIITGRSLINAQKQIHVGTGVSVKAGGINVTAGITTVQALQATTLTLTNDLFMSDGDQIELGTDNDLKIYHSGFNYIESHNDTEIHINAYTGGAVENMAKFKPNGAVELYHNSSKKIETTSPGGTLTGDFTFTGNIYGGNHITIQDSDGSSDMLKIGASEDLRIYHYNNSSYIRQHTDKPLYIGGTSTGQSLYIQPKDGENSAIFKPDGAVELYHNNIKTLDTTTTGIRIHGDEGGTAQLQLLADQGDDDGDYWRFVAETNGILNIQDYGAGSWYNNIRLTGNTGGVDLFHNNAIRLSTSTSGISIQNGNLALNRQDTGNEGGEIVFNRASDNANQWFNDVYGNDSAAKIRWHHGGSEKFVVKTNGHVAISNGNLELASGMGIDYSLVSDGSRSVSSNLLDDYEEGTFTPVVANAGSGGQTAASYTANIGWYTKVGNIVNMQIRLRNIVESGNGIVNSDTIYIRGFPFAMEQRTNALVVGHTNTSRFNVPSNCYELSALSNNSSSTPTWCRLFASTDNGEHGVQLFDSLGTTNQIQINMTYRVA